MSPDDEVEAIADELAALHAEAFEADPAHRIEQTCLVFRPGEVGSAAIPCGWNSAAEREGMLRALRMIIAAAGVTRYAIWSEVWAVLAPVPDGASREEAERSFGENYQNGDLAKHPERMECVFTLVVDASGAQANRMQKIVRGARGEVLTLHPMPAQAGLGGALASLLPPRRVH